MTPKRQRIMSVASDTTWARALERARVQLDMLDVSPVSTDPKTLRERERLERAVMGPKPPVADPNWLLTPHPYPEYQRVLITPALAQAILDNTHAKNRNPKPRKIAQFARKMLQGYWRFNNQGWAIDRNGNLQDGQNRALAVVLTGTTVDVAMFVGMPPENFASLDSGTPRSGKDTFDILGEDNSGHLSTAVKILLQVEQWGPDVHNRWRKFTVTNEEQEDGLRRYGDTLREGISMGWQIRRYLNVSVGAMGAAYYLISQVAPKEIADHFFTVFAKGAAEETEPIAVLRNQFLSRTARGQKVYDMYVQLALVLRAWNYTVEGEHRDTIHFDGRNKFPTAEKYG